ncbi:hypothetical protein C8R46DRAFT_373480 [Mycena filopes]|nr:hypothetical protein C8R46DRAFT_373480 [Mycena filopes]
MIAAILPQFHFPNASVTLEYATYRAELARIHTHFARGSLQNKLKLSLGERPDDTPQRVIADIIQPYASRLTSLDLHIDIDVVENLLRLPAGTFPQLQSLRLVVVHRVHTGWLLFRPEDELTMTNMLALAPRLSCFEFDHGEAPYFTLQESEEYVDCLCTFYPPHIGFNFAGLTHLVLSVQLPCVLAHELLHHCAVLRVCTMAVRTEGDYDAAALDQIEVPSLTSLSVQLGNYDAACVFWERLLIPALKNLEHTVGYSGAALMDCFERSETKLLTLRLQGVNNLDEEEFTEVMARQTDLTDLDMTDCKGRFWQALAQRPPVQLLPALEHFVYNNMDTWDVGPVIAFIDARCAPGGAEAEVSRLKTISLTSTYRHRDAGAENENDSDCPAASELRRLECGMACWEAAVGLHVDLSLSSHAIQCDYCFGEPRMYKPIVEILEDERLALWSRVYDPMDFHC